MKDELDEKYAILKDIPVKIDIARVLARLSFNKEAGLQEKTVADVVNAVASSISPAAVFKAAPVKPGPGSSLTIDGVEFNNPLLKVNLQSVPLVFPYAVTCEHMKNTAAIVNRPALPANVKGVIYEMVLAEAADYLRRYITELYHLDFLWGLQPGEMEAWPASGRKEVLSMLGNVDETIGLSLTADGDFIPKSSACGIFYVAEMELEGCQVCPQEPCMGRRAPYSEELARKYAHRARKPCGRK
jgi:hypothetical protein